MFTPKTVVFVVCFFKPHTGDTVKYYENNLHSFCMEKPLALSTVGCSASILCRMITTIKTEGFYLPYFVTFLNIAQLRLLVMQVLSAPRCYTKFTAAAKVFCLCPPSKLKSRLSRY